MKIARFFAYLFGILGTVVMVFSIGLCLTSLNREAKLVELPAGAEACAQSVMDAAQAGDYEALAQVLYGQPELGGTQAPEDVYGSMIWKVCRESLSYEFLGECYASEGYLRRDVSMTYLDTAQVTASLGQRAHDLLTARVAAAQSMEELYDDRGEFREDLMAQVLQEALAQCLAQEEALVTETVTLTLVYQGNRWQAVPGDGFYRALSGGVA